MDSAAKSDVGYPPSAQAWWAVSVFAVAAVLSYTDRQILSLLVDPIRSDLNITDTQISIVQGAAFAVLYSVIGLPLGWVADRVQRRLLLVAAVLTWSAGTAACGFAGSFEELFGARLFVALGEAALAPAVMSLLADYFSPARRATATGVFFTGMVIGAGAAISIGGALLEAARQGLFASLPVVGALAPWRAVLVLAGGAGLLVAMAMLTLIEPRRRLARADNSASLAAFGQEFRSKAYVLIPLYLALAIGSIVDYAVLSWTPALLTRVYSFSAGDVAVALGGVAIAAGLIGTPTGGFLTDWVTQRFGAAMRTRLAFALSLLGLAATPIGVYSSANVVLAAVFLWILISSCVGTIGIATILDLLPDDSRGLATSTIAFGNTIVGLTIGPTVVAVVTDYFYRAPEAVGLALTSVMVPVVLTMCLLFFSAMQRSARSPAVAA